MINYGRSVVTIADQLFGTNDDMTQDEKIAAAQKVYDSVLNAFPNLRTFMLSSEKHVKEYGYTETILGRRRHLPDMQLPEYEFKAKKNYVNPDIDPLDLSTLANKSEIPDRIIKQLTEEFKGYKYYGQVAKRTRELYEEGIQVVNNKRKITDASRQVVNCVDYETEILTTSGWKRYNEVKIGDEIFAYSMFKDAIVKDIVKHIHNNNGEVSTYSFITPEFNAVSTIDHRWLIHDTQDILISSTNDIVDSKRNHKLFVIAGNSFPDDIIYNDKELRQLGRCIHAAYLIDGVAERFTDRPVSFDLISSLSQNQARVLLSGIFLVDDLESYKQMFHSGKIIVDDAQMRDVIQYVACIAGYYTRSVEYQDSGKSTYEVNVYFQHSVTIQPQDIVESTSQGVWCVTTETGTWIARRHGCVYITGNSIIQGE